MGSSPTAYFIGDSTMADYDPVVYPNQRGWGQMFRNFMTGDISFVNAAKNIDISDCKNGIYIGKIVNSQLSKTFILIKSEFPK